MTYKNILNSLAEQRELIVPWFETAMLSERWPDSYTITIESGEYYGKGDGYFHPSTHPLKGARELFYEFHPDTKDKYIRERRSLQSQMTLAMGRSIHGVVQTQFQMADMLTPDNTEYEYINKDHHVRGRIDFIVDHPDGNQYPVELKAVACSTPVLTANGWSTMGELKDGEEVYAPDGQPTKILAAHPIRLGRPCYEVRFRDGQSVVVDEDHLWRVWDRPLKRDRVLTTKELAEAKQYVKYRFAVPVTAPMQFPEKDLPIDPWLLGMWLGDGTSCHADITCGEADLPYLLGRLDGLARYRVFDYGGKKAAKVSLHGIRGKFCALSLMGKTPKKDGGRFWGNKHIPEQYMLASEHQRRQLLAGLMDSDGTVGGHQVAICMVREGLMRQVLQLVRSLGYRATWNESRARLNGQDAGPVYWVKFSTGHEICPFDMPRKRAAYQSKPAPYQDLAKNSIVSVLPTSSVPTRCITVAHESSLYVIGEGFVPTHNTLNPYTFKKIEKIKPEWDAQLSLGLDNIGHSFGILLVVEAGWPYGLREFRVPRNDALLSDIYSKFDHVRQCIELDTPPRYCCTLGSQTMEKCPARFECWLKEEGK